MKVTFCTWDPNVTPVTNATHNTTLGKYIYIYIYIFIYCQIPNRTIIGNSDFVYVSLFFAAHLQESSLGRELLPAPRMPPVQVCPRPGPRTSRPQVANNSQATTYSPQEGTPQGNRQGNIMP